MISVSSKNTFQCFRFFAATADGVGGVVKTIYDGGIACQMKSCSRWIFEKLFSDSYTPFHIGLEIPFFLKKEVAWKEVCDDDM